MRKNTKQRGAKKQIGGKPREEYISYYNYEHYPDPVACAAINNVARQRRRVKA